MTQTRNVQYDVARRQIIDFIDINRNLCELDDYEASGVETKGIITLGFVVPTSIGVSVFKEGAYCRAQKYTDDGDWVMDGRTFERDSPLPVHDMVAAHDWGAQKHLLTVTCVENDENTKYSFDFDPEEIGRLVLSMEEAKEQTQTPNAA